MKLDDATRYHLLKLIAEHPEYSQRELAVALGISAGKTNFCVNVLVRLGLVKTEDFRRNRGKGAAAYLLTPKGAEDKAALSVQLLQYKRAQLEALRVEIVGLQSEQAAHGRSPASSLVE